MSGRAGVERVRAVSVGDSLETIVRCGGMTAALTAYHDLFARSLHESDVDAARVDESPGQVVLGSPPRWPSLSATRQHSPDVDHGRLDRHRTGTARPCR